MVCTGFLLGLNIYVWHLSQETGICAQEGLVTSLKKSRSNAFVDRSSLACSRFRGNSHLCAKEAVV